VGSGLNPFFEVLPHLSPSAKGRFLGRPFAKEVLDRFHWLDMSARLDLVSAQWVKDHIWRNAQVIEANMRRRQLVNADNPARDHGLYFRNRDLVMPRVIKAVYGGPPWAETDVTPARVRARVERLEDLTWIRLGTLATLGGLGWLSFAAARLGWPGLAGTPAGVLVQLEAWLLFGIAAVTCHVVYQGIVAWLYDDLY